MSRYNKKDLTIVFMDNLDTGACGIIDNAIEHLSFDKDITNDKTYYLGIECLFVDTAQRDGLHIVDEMGDKVFELDLQEGLRLDMLTNWLKINVLHNVR